MDRIYKYIEDRILQENEGLKWIRRQTNLRTNYARMMSGPVQGELLTLLTKMCGVHKALELGTFTGYASACIALGLKENGGHLDTLEVNDELNNLIQEGWKKTGVDELITLHTGDALTTLERFTSEGNSDFDLVYIDANKRDYCAYFEAILPLVRPGGVILADNTLWDGKVLEDPMPQDAQTKEIARFNDLIASDSRVESVILPLRDGLTVIRKRTI